MLKIIRCAVIVRNISRSAYSKLQNVKNRWTGGNKSAAVVDGVLAVTRVTCTAIVLYDPWILVRPLLLIVPYAIQYIPFVGTIPIVKMIVIYGLEFVTL